MSNEQDPVAGAVQAAQAILQPVPPPEPANPELLQVEFFLAFVRLFSRFMAYSRDFTWAPVFISSQFSLSLIRLPRFFL